MTSPHSSVMVGREDHRAGLGDVMIDAARCAHLTQLN